MSDEQLRIAVAEAMGWKPRESYLGDYEWNDPSGKGAWLPNFPASLDACASFEATLTADQQRSYAQRLQGPQMGSMDYLAQDFRAITASPRARCLAYLATVAPAKLK